MQSLMKLVLTVVAAWLAAQSVLAVWRTPQPELPQAFELPKIPGLLAQHWRASPVAQASDWPRTTLDVQWIGSLKAQSLQDTIVVLTVNKQQRALSVGQRLAPGVVLEQIDGRGLVFNRNGRRERLPWPEERPVVGIKKAANT